MIMARVRNYEKQIKEEAVSLIIDQGKTRADIAREMEIPKSTVSNWVNNYRNNGAEKATVTTMHLLNPFTISSKKN